jgi:2-polyprenyl-6-methoxyphenol hydroxylase-like FAD-dependent oxidoreductase
MDLPIAIVGGGPIGSALGLLLPSATVLEACRYPRDKPCGEGLMPAGAAILESLGVDLRGADFPTIAGVCYRLPSGEQARSDFKEGPGFGTRRLRLDALLAARAGVRSGVRLEGMRMLADGVELRTSEGSITANIVVGADGLRSTVARLMGWSRAPRGVPRFGVVGHIATWTPIPDVEVSLLGRVETYLAPTAPGEALFAILGPRGRLRHPQATVVETYRSYLRTARPDLGCAQLDGRLTGAGPFNVRPRSVASARVFLVGDAAGFLDPLTGDAMTAGLQQAQWLARLLAQDPGSAPMRYQRYCDRQWRTRRLVSGIALQLSRSQALSRRAVHGMARRPAALQRLLTVNQGLAGLGLLGPADWAALLGAV